MAGVNTLDFVVQDLGGVSGFIVGNIEGRAVQTVVQTVVPERSTFAMLGMGAMLLGITASRRRR